MALAAACHHGFELGAGAGVMLQRHLGLGAAVAGWTAGLPAMAALGRRRRGHLDRVHAVTIGMNVAGVAVHYTLWPWRLRPWPWFGVPVLNSAEGLAHGHLPAYNTILLSWGALSLAALAESPRCRRSWAAVGFVLALPMRRDARRHFDWIRCQARLRPAWWNRALRQDLDGPIRGDAEAEQA